MATTGTSPQTETRPGEYVVVARRYRPQGFDQLIGQEHVARGLTNAILTNRVGHAYLFTGARGVGKTSSARILAKALDCVQGPTPTPCNECDICQSISAGSDVDVLEIDGASNRGIDEIRQLRQNVNVRPSRARFKIYIIDEVHMLTKEAFNALLKTLEEPPEHVKFIFCTTEAEKIPITILSRCQRYDFAGIQTASISDRLAQIVKSEGVEADRDAIDLLARRAAGSMRDSQSLLEQLLAFGSRRITAADVHEMLGTASEIRLTEIVRAIVARNPAQALAALDGALGEGVDVGQLLDQLVGYLRDCMAAAVGCSPDAFLHISPTEAPQVAEAAAALGLETLLAVIGIFDQTVSRLRFSAHGRTLTEIALVRVCKLEDLQSLSSVIEQLHTGVPPQPPALAMPPVAPRPAGASSAGSLAAPKIATAPLTATPVATTPVATRSPTDLPAQPPSEPATRPAESKKKEAAVAQAVEPAPMRPAIDDINAALASDGPDDDSSYDIAGYRNGAYSSATNGHSHSSGADLLTTEMATELWKQALAELADLAAESAKMSTGLAILAPNRLAVSFPPKYNSAKQFCQRPDQTARLQQALSDVAGRPMTLEFRTGPDDGPANPAKPEPVRLTPAMKAKRDAEVLQNPLVKRAIELFDAKTPRVESPNPG